MGILAQLLKMAAKSTYEEVKIFQILCLTSDKSISIVQSQLTHSESKVAALLVMRRGAGAIRTPPFMYSAADLPKGFGPWEPGGSAGVCIV